MQSFEILPEVFRERLRRILPESHWEAAVESFTSPTPTTFRVNRLKAEAASILPELQAAGLELEAVPWYEDAFILRKGSLEMLQKTEAYLEGLLYVQTLSSMLPALILDPQPGETVLDLTAAPGSKTTQMAALMQGQGELIANDNNRIRFYKLKANVESQGAANVKLSRRAGQSFGKTQPMQFDRVLVDAPCSTEGRFYVHKPSSYEYWRPRKIHEMAHKQRALLLSGIRAAKPGGRILYSTCTFGPEENEAVVDWVLKREPTVKLVPFKVPLHPVQEGLRQWQGKSYQSDLALTQRVLPTVLCEGFYLACFERHTAGDCGL